MELNKIKQNSIIIELDRPRRIIFNLNALAELEEVYDTFQGAVEKIQKGSFSAIRALLYAGLKEDDPEITLDTAGSLVDLGNLEGIVSRLTKALESALPDQPKNQPGNRESKKGT